MLNTAHPQRPSRPAPPAAARRHQRHLGRWVVLLALVLFIAFGGTILLRDPVFGTSAVQLARDTVGPTAIAKVEQWAFRV